MFLPLRTMVLSNFWHSLEILEQNPPLTCPMPCAFLPAGAISPLASPRLPGRLPLLHGPAAPAPPPPRSTSRSAPAAPSAPSSACTCVHAYAHVCTRTHVHMHTHTHARAHMCTRTHARAHTCAHSAVAPSSACRVRGLASIFLFLGQLLTLQMSSAPVLNLLGFSPLYSVSRDENPLSFPQTPPGSVSPALTSLQGLSQDPRWPFPPGIQNPRGIFPPNQCLPLATVGESPRWASQGHPRPLLALPASR